MSVNKKVNGDGMGIDSLSLRTGETSMKRIVGKMKQLTSRMGRLHDYGGFQTLGIEKKIGLLLPLGRYKF